MSEKSYLDYEGLASYDSKIKDYIGKKYIAGEGIIIEESGSKKKISLAEHEANISSIDESSINSLFCEVYSIKVNYEEYFDGSDGQSRTGELNLTIESEETLTADSLATLMKSALLEKLVSSTHGGYCFAEGGYSASIALSSDDYVTLNEFFDQNAIMLTAEFTDSEGRTYSSNEEMPAGSYVFTHYSATKTVSGI